VIFILMFSPLNFPADRLPGWLAAIHNVLPIQAMGEVMRGTLASNSFPITFGAFALLGPGCRLVRRYQRGPDQASLNARSGYNSVLRRAVRRNALRPSSRPDQRSSVCSDRDQQEW